MFTVGQRVLHMPSGQEGTITSYLQTYDPIRNKTHYLLLVDGDNGHEWSANGSQVLILPPTPGDSQCTH